MLLVFLFAGPEHDLLWLPKELPQGVILILSTLPGRVNFVYYFYDHIMNMSCGFLLK